MFLDELLQRDGHLLLHHDGVVDVSRDAEQFCASVVWPAQRSKPIGASAEDRGRHGHGLHIGHRRGAAKQADVGREWGLDARFALATFQRLNQSCFLAADVGTRTAVQVDVEVVTRAKVKLVAWHKIS